ncbi:MAG: hypothetical protein JWP87_1920 [Labilithrix sp.]|nr:hypothetical protein [Labilithrix sp.]
MKVRYVPCVGQAMDSVRRSVRLSPLLLLGLMACSGGTSDAPAVAGDEPELREKALPAGDFAMVEQAGGTLSPFGCRHYMNLHVTAAQAVLDPRLDSADPADMDPDGSCGGEELPRNSASTYPVHFVEKSACGAMIYEGTIKWTDSGKVTRTLRLTDNRKATCADAKARVVAAITSSYQGSTNPIATYYSVDR